MINRFFVVTTTSVYRITVDGDNFTQEVKKIALKGSSKFPVDYILQGGSMISVGRHITVFTPHKNRKIEHVNTRYHGDQTSEIVALFESEEEAFVCFSHSDLKFWDPR